MRLLAWGAIGLVSFVVRSALIRACEVRCFSQAVAPTRLWLTLLIRSHPRRSSPFITRLNALTMIILPLLFE